MATPKTDLQKFLDTKKADTRLIGDIERHLMRQPESDRRTDVLHPSEIIKADWCHKYAYYLLNGGKAKKEKPNLRLQNIFDEGHFIHAKWQNRLADMGVLYGNWYCETDDKSEWGVSSEVNNGPSVFEYKEVPLVYEPLRIHGHADGWVKGIGDDCLIEIKSIFFFMCIFFIFHNTIFFINYTHVFKNTHISEKIFIFILKFLIFFI